MQKQQRVLIGIPTIGQMHWKFVSSLTSLITPPNTTITYTPRVMIDTARNVLAEKVFKEKDITHLLMIDDDHVFQSNILMKLLQHDVDVVGSLAFKRRVDFGPCVYKKNENGLYQSIRPLSFMEVDAIGSGCILIKREVIDTIPFPWFETYYDENKNHWSVDFVFCKKAKEHGFKIYCDPSVIIGHLGDQPVLGEQDFQSYLKNKKIEIDYGTENPIAPKGRI